MSQAHDGHDKENEMKQSTTAKVAADHVDEFFHKLWTFLGRR
jgi:hypothetical protein